MPEQSNLETNGSSRPTIELRGIRTFAGGRAVVFSVAITQPTTSRVFIEIARADGANDRQAVVFVETDRFVAAWRREPYGFNREAAYGTLDRSRLEKYEALENDFPRSHQTPVPLAHVICRKDEEKKTERATASTCGRRHVDRPTEPYYVDFNEGVTRTFWLIAHGARAFPVAIDSSEASDLHREAGLSEMPPITIERLFVAALSISFNSSQRG
ncbi:MAG: plasmid fertility inhibition factor family protein [Sulfurifustis sp.]